MFCQGSSTALSCVRTVGFPTAVGHSSAQAFLFIPLPPSIPAPYGCCLLPELPAPCATVSYCCLGCLLARCWTGWRSALWCVFSMHKNKWDDLMYILIHQMKVLNYDTSQKNINSVLLSFLETFLTVAQKNPKQPKACTAPLLPTTSIWNSWLTVCPSFMEMILIQRKMGKIFSTSQVVHCTSQNLAVF